MIFQNSSLLTHILVVKSVFTCSLNCIKQNRLKGTLHWTPLFLKKKVQSDEYDIPLDRVEHWREPHVFSFLICGKKSY